MIILNVFLRAWENEKVKNFLPLARSRNPENPSILDNLEGKPSGLFEESIWLREFNKRRLFSREVLRFLKCYIR